MLYQFLMDDVNRKQMQDPRQAGAQNELVESGTGELVPGKKENGLLRTRSTPKRKEAFHYPMRSVRRDSREDVEKSLPKSPQTPASTATRATKVEESRRNNRLTM